MHNNQQSRFHRLAFKVSVALLVVAGVAGAGYAFLPSMTGEAVAAGEGKKAKASQSAPAEQRDDSPFAQHSKQAGAKACRDVFTVLGPIMASGSSYKTATFWNQKEGDKHAISTLAGLNFDTPDFKGNGAGLVYSAPVNGGCEGISVRVVPVQGTCPDFAASLADNVVETEDLYGVPLMMLKSGAKVMAMPAGDNMCVAITTMFANGALE
ncbi:hypothetical protein [Pseudochrobactrum sp. HB0163]|uniref:hypothetical protein n=1 Tax=Pseudochrobactrum sp. HB0163 TaxID=3450708 RepID=UPI003F6E152E